ncbi:SdpI family protein [Patescibacteria group bacterium]|nr:SdpI family protein [Patescibacteria group bacterium]
MKIFTKKEMLPIILIIIAFVVGLQLHPSLPNEIPTHWDAQGEIDGWGSKGFAVFFTPLLALGVYLLMTFIPLIDPLRKKYKDFAIYYFWIKTIIILFFLALYFYTLAVAKGFSMNINYFILPAISILFIVLGSFMPKIKKNYFVGIRTPWTIHSETVWNETHKFAGKVFMIMGTVSLLSLIIKGYTFPIFIIIIIAGSLAPVVYSYFIFKKKGGFEK